MKQKLLTKTPMCPRERLVIISSTTGLSFAKERIGPLAAIITTVFYLLALYLFALPNTPENPFSSIYSETLIKTTSQHLPLLVGFDTLIYRKYYDTSPILVGHQPSSNDIAARTKPVLGFPPLCRVQCAGDSHNTLQEGIVSLEGDIRRTKKSGTTEHHHLASPPSSMRHHDLEVTTISRFVTLACGLNIIDTQHRWD
jgi:hypothetical protein